MMNGPKTIQQNTPVEQW